MPLPMQPPGFPSGAPSVELRSQDEPNVFTATPAVPEMNAQSTASAHKLLRLIADDRSSEVILNGPNDVLEKVRGVRYHIPDITFGDAATYHRALNDYLLPHTDSKDRIDGANILVEGQLTLASDEPNVPPMLARVHILCPPLVPYAKVTIAKKSRYELTLDSIAAGGAMTQQMADFLKAVAQGRLTAIVSGPTGAGKSTLLQAMTHHFDQNDRVIVVEDTPELRLPLADTTYLCSTTAKPGVRAEDMVTTEWLVKAANRMRMNRIVVGECRGAEMAEWLIAANSGAEGSLTTVHADNPRRALDKVLALATKSPTAGSEGTLRREIAATVDVIVQAGLIDGRHVVTHIEEVSNTVRDASGLIATTSLFEFDRNIGAHLCKGQPSEDLVSRLAQQGVPINAAWFRRTAR